MGFVFISDDNIARRCVARPVPVVVFPVFQYVPMITAPVSVVVPKMEIVTAAIRTLLDQSGIHVEGVQNMAHLSNLSSPELAVSAEGPFPISVSIYTAQPAYAVTTFLEVSFSIPVIVTEDTNADTDTDCFELSS